MEEEKSLIQLKNYRPHPTDEKYMVFLYHDERMADAFEAGLTDSGTYFEKDTSNEGPNKRWLFAVHRRDMEQARASNNLAIGTYRQPFISDPLLRYVVLGLCLGLILLAIIGYLKSN